MDHLATTWRSRSVAGAALASFVISIGAPAAAESPEGIMKHDRASSGATDVASGGFEATVSKPEAAKDSTTAKISAGGLINAGNSRSLAATSAADVKLRRSENQLTALAAANYGRAAAGPGEPVETTVENFQGKVRYDRFLSGAVAVFFAASARRDRFQGLDLRLNVDPGVAYYFLDAEKHQLWAEAGYDYQHDVRRDENIAAAAADARQIDKTEDRHSARLFAGYDNELNSAVTFDTGLEYLQSVQRGEDWRLNYELVLTSAIAGRFGASTTVSLRYDNHPLPRVEELDLVTSFQLVYTLL